MYFQIRINCSKNKFRKQILVFFWSLQYARNVLFKRS